MNTTVRYPDVEVQLTGTDGNAFAIIANVQSALRKAGYREAADEFWNEANQCGSYDELLRLAITTVDVS